MNPADFEDDFDALFAPEPAPEPEGPQPDSPRWKVMLVDDEADIHAVLRLALQDMVVEGRPLRLFDAGSAEEAKAVLAEHPDMALILLDVVMETDQAGLNLVRHIRQHLHNRSVQIVLITGQPGYAPQRSVVAEYEIDGYRLKSELTADKIFVSVYAAIRTYQVLCELNEQREKLEAQSRSLREKEARLRTVVETAPDAIILADQAARVIGWNEGAQRVFGYSAEEMLGESLTRLIPERLRGRHLAAVMRIGRGRPPRCQGRIIEMEGLRQDGSEFPVELVLGSWSTPTGHNLSAVVRDITERKQTESRLRLAASVFANSYEGIMICDANNIIAAVNPAFSRITGYAPDEVIGHSPRMLASGRHDAGFYARMWTSLLYNDFWQDEIWNKRKEGQIYAELLAISVVRDNAGRVQHYIGVFSDISLIKEHEAELYRIANYDILTGVPNRRLLVERLGQAVNHARKSGKPFAICYLDLDGFKPINDQLGHDMGDRLLVGVAERIKTVLRSADTLARIGGDEFVLLFADLAESNESTRIIERIQAALSSPFQINGLPINITASLGVTLFPLDDADADTLLRHADQAMYRAKEAGKNRCHFFDPKQDRLVQTNRLYQQRLREALDRREFVLHFQPQVDLTSGEVVGAEALIRWQHPERGLLAPGDFLMYLAGTDLEFAVGEWVIETVLSQIAIWRAAGLSFNVSANVSANHLLQGEFANRLRVALERHPDVPPARLELEILETASLSDMNAAVNALMACRQLGVRFALDDFGTGYSSLTYFRNLPVHVLKIDQSFVRDMLEDPDDLSIVESVVRLAGVFNRPVIAEGVETMDHGAKLLELGCRLAQGYGIARPMPAPQIPAWIAQWRDARAWLRLIDAKAKGSP
ncbi:two-component system response regulator [Methyloterricola oryzae]|uniref:two-component system response regulator n=1 Tax=Methyloterricola oryzae TaxID=1495050 RepID=UPI000699AE24|nr:EAL domain-containing protein [Methyloterricola oryzae]